MGFLSATASDFAFEKSDSQPSEAKADNENDTAIEKIAKAGDFIHTAHPFTRHAASKIARMLYFLS
jgi:hypothetical protein